MPVGDLKSGRLSAYIAQPGKDERKLLKAIHTGDFYGHSNKDLQEKHYPLHLVCATRNDCFPPIFTIKDDGRLAVAEERYYYCKDQDTVNSLNPFSCDGLKQIQEAAQKGIEIECHWRTEVYYKIFQDCVPELAAVFLQTFSVDEEDTADSA